MEAADKNVLNALRRLKGITGFATTLCREGDPRARVFNRYDHIRRMLWINSYFCGATGVNPERANEIILLHDLNRWPFAQNSEKGYFDQSAHTAAFLPELVPGISEETVRDVIMLHRKQLSGMGRAARPAYIADVIAGMIEDPLLLITGLNADPEIVPERLVPLLGLDLSPAGTAVLAALCETLNRKKDAAAFSRQFRELFETLCKRFIDRHAAACGTLEELEASICRDTLTVKEEFLLPIVFPINNEKVCHGGWIKRQIIGPLIDAMGLDEAGRYLLSVDEAELLEELRKSGRMRAEELSNAYPHLDYTSDAGSGVKALIPG